jgi:hypothetical protein
MSLKKLPSFDWGVYFFGLNSSFKTSLIPFLFALPTLLRSSDAFLQIWLGSLDSNIF